MTSEKDRAGLLVVNLGTPDAPTKEALKRYLKEFLWDRRVVDVPRLIWWFILNGWILKTRPKKSAKLYEKIWTEEGSPLFSNTLKLAKKLSAEMTSLTSKPVPVAVGMRYGKPAIADAMEELRAAKCDRILVLPLYPQYAAATTASAFDAVGAALKSCPNIPDLRFIREYHERPEYVAALADQILAFWENGERPHKLVFSFHGLPKKSTSEGDPYFYQCHKTARLTAEALRLKDDAWTVAFQSRFGEEEWLKPYVTATLAELARGGTDHVDVVCPGFSADCLETLEEIAMQNRDAFLRAGGKRYRYIPALNDNDAHARALAKIAADQIRGWL
jgi:ferrochelatase